MKEKKFLIILSIICFFIIGFYVYQYFNKTVENNPITMTKEEILDENTVKEYVNKNTDANINNYQSKEIVKTVERIIEHDRKPNQVVTTTGKDYKQVSKEQAEKKKVDATIIAPAKNETKTVDEIKEDDIVNLNQYNVYAYPKRQLSFTYYADHDKAIDLEYQIKLFGKHMYAGPSVKISDNGKTTVGVKVTVPF